MKQPLIRTALLSYGMSGEVFHGPLLDAHPNFEIAAVFQRNASKKPIHAFPVVYSIDTILKDSSIELVIVNTPNDSHYDYAKKALLAGKHVIVEKPFTVTTAEADDLIALAKAEGKMLSVFQNRRWDGGFLTVKKVLEQKLLGRVVELEFHYDRYRNYIEAGSWKEEDKPGIGILYNLGSHMLDQVLVLLGKPRFVDARLGSQRTDAKVNDYYDIRLAYDGLNVIVKSSYLVREQGPMYKLHGTQGSFVKYGIDPQEQALKEKKVPGTAGWGIEPESWWGLLNTSVGDLHFTGKIETLPGNYLTFYDNIFEHLRHGKPLAVKAEEARDVITVIEACFESSQNKRAVKLN